jgi:hypothetical protein
MKGNEVADVGLEAADLFAARIEWMNEANLVAGPGAACISRP